MIMAKYRNDLNQLAKRIVETATGEQLSSEERRWNMNAYLISYDLKQPEQDYDKIIKAIETLDKDLYNVLDSAYIIKHDSSAYEICNFLKNHINDNDRIFVCHIDENYDGCMPIAPKLLIKAKIEL
jgi:hypothetical protein